jgi:sulfur carrier protein ThiS
VRGLRGLAEPSKHARNYPHVIPVSRYDIRVLTRVRFTLHGMQITFKLFATLTDYLPPDVRTANQMGMDVSDGTTVQTVVDQFNMPPKLVHLVLVNGVYIAPDQRATHALKDSDVLAVWPPIAGG